MNNTDHHAAIAATVRDYVFGMCRAEADLLRQSMHEKSCCIGHYEGGLEWDGREAFIAGVEAAVSEPDPAPWYRINAVTITGDVAVAQVEDIWLGMHFDDTLTILHHDGRWVIVSKVFYLREG